MQQAVDETACFFIKEKHTALFRGVCALVWFGVVARSNTNILLQEIRSCVYDSIGVSSLWAT